MSASTEAANSRIDTRVPDFFIVGHPKSGTTALYEMLRSHPEIFMPGLKEPLYFDRELHPQLTANDAHPDTLEQYLELFAPAADGQLKGEASANYLRSQLAARRIAELQPEAMIIAILREPASFLRSLHLQLLKHHGETEKDLRRAIEREQRERDTKPVLRYSIDRIEYTAQLRRYHEAFGKERVLVLIYDDFRADNRGTLRRALRFLGADETAPIDTAEANRTVSVRSPRMYQLMRSVSLGATPGTRVAKATIKALTPRRLRRDGLRTVRDLAIYGPPPPPDEQLMLELRRRFKGEVEALSEYLGRDMVAEWGYDRLD